MTACAKTVLLVDDSSTARRIESLLLKQKHVRRGYEAGSSDYTGPSTARS